MFMFSLLSISSFCFWIHKIVYSIVTAFVEQTTTVNITYTSMLRKATYKSSIFLLSGNNSL